MSYLYERPYVEFRLSRTQSEAIQAVSVLGGTGDGEQFNYLFPALNLITSQTGSDESYFIDTINDSAAFGNPVTTTSNGLYRYGYKIGAGKWLLEYECESIVRATDFYADNAWLTSVSGTTTNQNFFFVNNDMVPRNLEVATFTKIYKNRQVLPFMNVTVNSSGNISSISPSTSKFVVKFQSFFEFEYSGSDMILPEAGGSTVWNRSHGCRSMRYKLTRVD